MDIKPDEIKKIKIVGDLNGDKVKMLVTKGGFHLFVGKKRATNQKMEALTASSHKAIGMHQLEKEFPNFKPVMNKSEYESAEKLEEHTSILPESMLKNGYEIYTLKKHNNVNFVLCKYGIDIMNYNGLIIDNELSLKKNQISNTNDVDNKVLSKCMTKLIETFIQNNNIDKINIK
jgi:hypothetical protein